MKRLTLIIPVIAILMAWRYASEEKTDTYTGYAYGEGSEKLLYIEEFTDKFTDGEHVEITAGQFLGGVRNAGNLRCTVW